MTLKTNKNFKLWRILEVPKSELQLDITLNSGQSFRWHKIEDLWYGVAGNKLWILKQEEEQLFYRSFKKELKTHNVLDDIKTIKLEIEWNDSFNQKSINFNNSKDELQNSNKVNELQLYGSNFEIKTDSLEKFANNSENIIESNQLDSKDEFSVQDIEKVKTLYEDEVFLRDYFQLQYSLEEMMKDWCSRDENFKIKSASFSGVRILRQDPFENLISFICSSCNNITRISSMVENLCETFGEQITQINEKIYFQFPNLKDLAADDVEIKLRKLGFGYRAKYIHKTAKILHESYPTSFLNDLKLKTYEEAKLELIKLPGIGDKVADCICLMSLDKLNSVPVDIHIRQVAEKSYNLKITSKSLSDASYKQIGNFFRDLWGDFAGWAQSIIFAAELKQFQHLTNNKKLQRKKIKK